MDFVLEQVNYVNKLLEEEIRHNEMLYGKLVKVPKTFDVERRDVVDYSELLKKEIELQLKHEKTRRLQRELSVAEIRKQLSAKYQPIIDRRAILENLSDVVQDGVNTNELTDKRGVATAIKAELITERQLRHKTLTRLEMALGDLEHTCKCCYEQQGVTADLAEDKYVQVGDERYFSYKISGCV